MFGMKLIDPSDRETFEFLPSLVHEIIKQKWFTLDRSAGTVYEWWTDIEGDKQRDGTLKFVNMDTQKGKFWSSFNSPFTGYHHDRV